MNSEIVRAIESMNLIEFNYDGENRIVEPHCYGITTANNEGLRAFQVDGYSSSGKMGWKMYDLGKASFIKVLDNTFNDARPGYKKNDSGMTKIYAQI
jgi:hypothetical protein